MDTNRMLHEIWEKDIQWTLGKDKVRGVYMKTLGVTLYAANAEDAIRKVWLYLYMPQKYKGDLQ